MTKRDIFSLCNINTNKKAITLPGKGILNMTFNSPNKGAKIKTEAIDTPSLVKNIKYRTNTNNNIEVFTQPCSTPINNMGNKSLNILLTFSLIFILSQ